MNNFEKQGTSKPEASNEKVNGDMAWEGEELEQDDVQLATDELAGVVGGSCDQDPAQGPGGYNSWSGSQQGQYNNARFNATMRGLGYPY